MTCLDLLKEHDEMVQLPKEEILASLPCGIVILNTQGMIIWMNKAARHLLGDHWEGILWVEVIQHAFAPKADDGHEVSLVDGRRVNVAISSLDALPGQLVTLIDMTTTRDYEQAKANQDQLMMIGRMTAQLAHQIRTPLSSAILYTDHLLHKGTHDERSLQWLARLQDCHASIEQQIEDLLLFARGDAVQLVPASLKKWSEQLLERAHPLIQSANAVLRVDNRLKPINCPMHSESLTGALLNLIHNALDAGANDILITMQHREHGGVIIEVMDNGHGFSEEAKNQAFTPFFTTKAQGNGLGLSVVYAVAKAHGGDVILNSSPGQGCCVTITLMG